MTSKLLPAIDSSSKTLRNDSRMPSYSSSVIYLSRGTRKDVFLLRLDDVNLERLADNCRGFTRSAAITDADPQCNVDNPIVIKEIGKLIGSVFYWETNDPGYQKIETKSPLPKKY